MAILCAFSSSAGAFTDEEWQKLPSAWEGFQSWYYGEQKTGESTLSITSDDAVTGSAAYDDLRGSAIGLVNYGSSSGTNPSALTIKVENKSGTLSIDMTNNPHAGILIARTVQDRTAIWSGYPSLTIDGALNINGNVGGAAATDTGDFTTGIAVGVGELKVKGDLTIDLIGMNSQAQADREQIPEMNKPYKWAQYYGWTNLDGRRGGSSTESTFIETNRSYLLQGGIVTGLSDLAIEGDVDIHVSGKNGILGGWIQAPNTENWHQVPDAFQEMNTVVAGDTKIRAELENQSTAYGLFGIAIQRGETGTSNLPDQIDTQFGGDVSIELDGNGGTIVPVYSSSDSDDVKESTYRLETANAIGLYTYGAQINDVGDIDISVTGVKSASRVGGFELSQNSYLNAAQSTISIDVRGNGSDIGTLFGFYVMHNPDDWQTPEIKWNTVDNLKIQVDGDAEELLGLYVQGTHLSVNSADIAVHRSDASNLGKDDYAIRVDSGAFDQVLTINEDGTGAVHISGNLFVEANNSRLRARFGSGDYLVGSAWVDLYESLSTPALEDEFAQYGAGLWWEDIDLTFSNGAFWRVTGDSNVTNLALQSGGLIDLSGAEASSAGQFARTSAQAANRILDIRNFTGASLDQKASSGVFRVAVDLSQEDLTQQGGSLITVLGSVDEDQPYAQLEVLSTGVAGAERSRPLVLDSSDGHNLALELVSNSAAGRSVEIGAWLYELRSVTDEDGSIAAQFDAYFESREDFLDEYDGEYFTEQGDRYWYLERTGSTNPTTDDAVSVASFGLPIVQYLGHLSTLRDRLGDVRYKGENGAWARFVSSKDRINGIGGTAAKVDMHTLYAGVDSRLQNTDWTVGGLLRYSKADEEGRGLTRLDSDVESWGGSLYATWNGRKEADKTPYADFVLSFDRFDQDLDGTMADGVTGYKGSYKTWGLGASVELGYRYDFEDYPGWFMEPSAQLSYYRIDGKHFRLSNGMHLRQSDVDSLTGRVGLTAGRFWVENGRRTTELYAEFGLNHEFLGKQTIRANDASYSEELLGTRVYYGLGITKALSGTTDFWLQVSREEGDDYTREYEANAGIRWLF